MKFFLSNAPADTPMTVLLLVAFDRWRIERMFEDSKGELGLDHFEVRRYGSLCRHLLLACVSHLFLAAFRRVLGPEHPKTLSTMNNLATVLEDSGKLAEAEPADAPSAPEP